MRRNSWLVLVAVASLLTAWFALRHRPAASTPANVPDQAARAEKRGEAPILDSPTKDSEPRKPVEAGAESADASSIPKGQAALDVPLLVVSIMSKADGKPLAHVRVMVSLASTEGGDLKDVATTHGDLHNAPISDEHGRVEVEVPAGEALDVSASSAVQGCGATVMEVHALDAHERREIELHVPCGDDLRFYGRLLDWETRLPVSGATVRLSRDHARLVEQVAGSRPKAIAELHTDSAGRFNTSLASWMEPHLRIEADGYGLLVALPQRDHESEAQAQDLLISRAGTLRAFVLDAAGKPVAHASVHLAANGYELRTGGEVEEPGSWVMVADEEWKSDLDAQGGCTITGLPAHVPLTLEIRRDEQVVRHEADPLRLEPGQLLERTWTIGGGARIEGRILDQFSAPVAEHEVWLLKKSGSGEGYMDAYKRQSTTAKGDSDEQGRFVLEDVPAGKWWIVAAPAADVRAAPAPDAVASKTQTIDVASSATQSVTLIVSRGLFVRGHVLDPNGSPVSDDFVACTQNDDWFPGQTRSDDKGAFVLGPLVPGTCTLWASDHHDFAASDKVTAEPGQTDVILRLHAAGKVSGHVVDASTGKPCAATIHVTPDHTPDNPMGGEFEAETREEGWFLFENLPPDHYHLSFATTDGRFASLDGIVVTAGHETGDLVAKAVPGGKLSIRYEGQAESVRYRIQDGSLFLGFAQGIVRGEPKLVPVPAGRVTIEYTIEKPFARHTSSVEVGVGEMREIVLRDDG